MEQPQVKSPVWKTVLGIIFLIFLYIILAMVASSCGARKAQSSVVNSKDEQSDKSTSVGNVSSQTSKGDSTVTKTQTAKVDEKQESKITELFNENGTLKQRITELLNSKSTDNSYSQQKSVKWLYLRVDSNFNNTHYITRTITIHTKDKKTDANNNALYWSLFGLGVFAIAAFFVYKWLIVPKA